MADFFEFREQVTARVNTTTATVAAKLVDTSASASITVSQLSSQIDRAIRGGVPPTVTVRGEVSRPKHHQASGHLYFTLKDANACIDAVMWKSDLQRVKFQVENGLELLASGSVKVFAPQGKYQLYVNRLQPVGAGALELALKQMRAKLEAEGLFAEDRKRSLPRFPKRIAIVTSRSTAAVHDVLKVLRRFSFLELFVFDVPVQGDGAGQKIAAAVRHLSDCCSDVGGIDLIILTRGGGSLEDLWQFNEECVARAIAASSIPIITGIGHDIDVSIADLVADHHAHTPTEAATVATMHWLGAIEKIKHSSERLATRMSSLVADARLRLNAASRNEFFRRPAARFEQHRMRLTERQRALDALLQGQLRLSTIKLERALCRFAAVNPRHLILLQNQQLQHLRRRLDAVMNGVCDRTTVLIDGINDRLRAMSPKEVLRRGYSITTMKRTGEIIRNATAVGAGDKIVTRLADGEIESIAQDMRQPTLFE